MPVIVVDFPAPFLLPSILAMLTHEQIEFYNIEGYLILPNFLSDDDLAPAVAAMKHKVDLIADELFRDGLIPDKLEKAPFETRLALLFKDKTDKDFLKYGRSWRDRFAGYFQLMSNPNILDVVECLIGPEIFANPVYNTRPKVPKVAAGAVPWHQDKSYWPDANSNPVITVWIPFVHSTPENGCLHIWPRTHKTKMLSYRTENYSGTGYLEIAPENLDQLKREAIPLPVSKGSAILFNDRCVHMSTPNNSDHVRWSVDLRYQPTDQDPMPQHGAGFLARSRMHPDKIATVEDWLALRPEHQ